MTLAAACAAILDVQDASYAGDDAATDAPAAEDAESGADASDAARDVAVCADEHDLCDDFDHGDGGLDQAWIQSTHQSGSWSLVDAAFSPPYAFAIEVNMPGTSSAGIKRQIGANGTGAKCTLKMFVESLSGPDDFAVLTMAVGHEGGEAALTLVRRPDYWGFVEAQGAATLGEQPLALAIAPGGWRTVTIDWTFGAPEAGVYTLTVDTASDPKNALAFDTTTPLQSSVSLAAYVNNVADARRVRYDDVACDITR